MDKGSNFYLCHTPYHIFNVLGLATKNPGGCLVIVGDFSPSILFRAKFESSFGSLFDQIVWLPGYTERHPALFRYSLAILNSFYLFIKFLFFRPSNVYICHDMRPEGIVVAGMSRQYEIPLSLIEDGTANYIASQKDTGALRKILAKLFLKKAVGEQGSIGTFVGIRSVYATFPLLYPGNAVELHKIEGKDFFNPQFVKKCREFVGEMVLAKIRKVETIYILPLGHERKEWLSLAKRNYGDVKFLLKEHPRESDAGLGESEVNILPKEIPMEIVFVLSDSLKRVVSNGSSALMTARWLRPEIEAINLGKINNPTLVKVFEKSGVLGLN